MATKKKGKKKAAAKKTGGGAGRPSVFAGKAIFKNTEGGKNPRREGTAGHKSFALIKNGMTYESYASAGGRRQDLAYDVAKGYVKVKAA